MLFLALMLSYSVFTMAQDSKWKLLYSDSTTKQKTYVDTYRTQQLDFLDAHLHIVVIWLRVFSQPTQQGEYVQQEDEKFAIDPINNQYEIKAYLKRYNGKIIEQKQLDGMSWTDIYPETNAELLLFYCKEFLKENK